MKDSNVSSKDDAQRGGINRRQFAKHMTAFGGIVGSALNFSTATASGDTARTLRIGLITPPPHQWNQTATKFGDQLRAATDGRLDIGLFPSGQLGSESQMLQLLQIGALDFAFLTTSELANRLSAFSAFYTPYVAPTATDAANLLSGAVAQNILQEVDRIGLHGLGFGMAGMRQVVSRQKVSTLEELRGRKVRVVPDLPLTDFWRYANAAPTPIPLSSLYDAFANGQVDAMHIDFENTLKQKYYTHAQSVLESNHMLFPMVAVASKRSWVSLSKADQSIISGALPPLLNSLRHTYAELDAKFRAELVEAGVSVRTVENDFFSTAQSAWERKWTRRTPYIDLLRKESSAMMKAASDE